MSRSRAGSGAQRNPHLGFAESDRWTARGRAVDARAATRPDVLPPSGDTTYPRYVARAQGAHVWDVDGNRYVDLLMGYGPVILGHAHPDVVDAVRAELAEGICFAPLWSPRQVELTELLVEHIPGAEQVLLLKTGSDATSAAVRLARIHTGRVRVARWGYNGWHDWSVDPAAGIPPEVRRLSSTFDLDDLESLARLFEEHPNQIACVVTMPFEYEHVEPTHLRTLRELVRANGALLVFDEVRSGFRMALGGAQEHFGVTADLVAFSKAMANGFSISAVTGPREIMMGLALTKISSTFFANPVDMAAAIATIGILRDTDALADVWELGTALIDGLNAVARRSGSPVEVIGYAPTPFLRYVGPPARQQRWEQAFYQATTAGGILLHPAHQWFLSAAHTPRDIDQVIEVCAAALQVADRT